MAAAAAAAAAAATSRRFTVSARGASGVVAVWGRERKGCLIQFTLSAVEARQTTHPVPRRLYSHPRVAFPSYSPFYPLACFRREAYGEMIACDNPNCPIEWFHLGCVGLSQANRPSGEWFCPECKRVQRGGAPPQAMRGMPMMGGPMGPMGGPMGGPMMGGPMMGGVMDEDYGAHMRGMPPMPRGMPPRESRCLRGG